MTIPIERTWAIKNSRTFLRRLSSPYTQNGIKKIPKDIRRLASQLLRHYPTELEMERAQKLAPEIFGSEEKTK